MKSIINTKKSQSVEYLVVNLSYATVSMLYVYQSSGKTNVYGEHLTVKEQIFKTSHTQLKQRDYDEQNLTLFYQFHQMFRKLFQFNHIFRGVLLSSGYAREGGGGLPL